MKYLLFSAGLFAVSCASSYKSLKKVTVDQGCVEKFRPQELSTAWYSAGIDVVGRHLSGLLLIKQMPDHAQRVVLTSETGVTLFDFEYKSNGVFELRHAIPQLRKKIVINTLQKDFRALLGIPFRKVENLKEWQSADEVFFGVEEKGDRYFFVTDRNCTTFKRIEEGGRNPFFSITMFGDNHAPEHVVITHQTFNMIINLHQIQRDAVE